MRKYFFLLFYILDFTPHCVAIFYVTVIYTNISRYNGLVGDLKFLRLSFSLLSSVKLWKDKWSSNLFMAKPFLFHNGQIPTYRAPKSCEGSWWQISSCFFAANKSSIFFLVLFVMKTEKITCHHLENLKQFSRQFNKLHQIMFQPVWYMCTNSQNLYYKSIVKSSFYTGR